MLYVFHVDVGRMMSFDMTVALSSVENLKDTIERLHGIPASNIVLLVSGGEMLTQATQVSFYSAGTDMNPIYMFLNSDVRLNVQPLLQTEAADVDLREQVERCLQLPAVYETVVTRAQLAHRMYELARDEERLCERLVHYQHLQQQGWSAVVANMEDLTKEFRERFRNFCIAFDHHLERRSKYLELLSNFGDDLTKLARIPILPGLMPLAEEDFHGFDEFLDTDEVFSRSTAQGESVVMTGAADDSSAAESELAAGGDVCVEEQPAHNQADSGDNSDMKSSSTSPSKKLKMGDDETLEEQQRTTTTTTTMTTIVTTATTTTTTSASSATRRPSLNLLQWITSKENHNTLKLMSDECVQGLGTFNEEVYETLKTEVQKVIKFAEQNDVKEIKGLSDRLCKLEDFKKKITSMVQDQKELSTAFQQNQNRAKNLRDASILPDLCASHESQLVVMQKNHQKIRDLCRCIEKAKDELGINLHTRLKRIVWIENAMNEFDNRLLFYHRCLRRAERHINIIEQIHQAPCIYVAAVTEVVRRKIFSGEFCLWASKLATDFDCIHSEEIQRRLLFNNVFEGHFLNILFPGMNDMPPTFANENPLVFDARLPNITTSDIDILTSQLPDLAPQIQLPDMGPVINFFVSRSGAHQKERMEALLTQQLQAAMSIPLKEKFPLQHQRLSELQREAGAGGDVTGSASGSACCEESETDTETEFETVPAAAAVQTAEATTSTSENALGALPEMVARSTATEQLLTQSAETLTEETESSMRVEMERLRAHLSAMFKLSLDCIQMARVNLKTFQTDATACRDDLQSELELLGEKWTALRMQSAAREEQLGQADQELQLLRQTLQNRDEQLELLQQQQTNATATLQCELTELRERLESAQLDKENAVARTRETLIHEHKTEIESLRCRFKLMTSMEHSPVESLSPEKHERSVGTDANTQMITLVEHERILAQLRDAYENEREKEIGAAVEAERANWNSESVMNPNISILKEMLEEKERQLDQMREKDLMLTMENFQLKTRLDALTNEEGNSWLKDRIECLHRDKCRLEEELTSEKSRRLEMESSVAALKSTSSTQEHQGLSLRAKSSTSSGSSSHRHIVLESCAKGDIVFVVWSMRHGQFIVVQDSLNLYFVHGDSLAALNLRLPTPAEGAGATDEHAAIPMPYYAIGHVIEKEYCQARKDENRYRVKKGSKFYRIKLAPVISTTTRQQATRRERIESFSTSISRSVSQGDSYSESSALRPSCSMGSTGSGNVGFSTGAAVAGLGLAHYPSSSAAAPMAASASAAMTMSPSSKDVVDYQQQYHATTALATMPLAAADNASRSTTTVVAAAAAAPIAGGALLGFKERTISITSVNEEDDEPVSLLSERCRYISVSEEEESMTPVASVVSIQTETTAAATATTTSMAATTVSSQQQQQQLQQQQQQSVITEQPTASSQLKLDLLLAAVDITQHDADMSTTITTTTAAATAETSLTSSASEAIAISDSCATVMTSPPQIIIAAASTADTVCALSVPTSIGTTSEDSDEYRSLEAKDDTDLEMENY